MAGKKSGRYFWLVLIVILAALAAWGLGAFDRPDLSKYYYQDGLPVGTDGKGGAFVDPFARGAKQPIQVKMPDDIFKKAAWPVNYAVDYRKWMALPDDFAVNLDKIEPEALVRYNNCPPETRRKIFNIHRRFWQNYKLLTQAHFDYSRCSTKAGKTNTYNDDIEVRVDIKYGYGIFSKGKDGNGQAVELATTPDGIAETPARMGENYKSTLFMFQADMASPKYVHYFNALEEAVTLPGKPAENVYDVLIIRNVSSSTGKENDSRRLYFNRATGMPERLEWGGAAYLEKYGKCGTMDIEYVKIGPMYVPTRIASEEPYEDSTKVEAYKNIVIKALEPKAE